MKKTTPPARGGTFAAAGPLFATFKLEDSGGYITQEFQDYGYRLAVALDDLAHKSLYIKLAKTVPRGQLERALSYVSDAQAVKSKARLFMWRLRQLKKEQAGAVQEAEIAQTAPVSNQKNTG